MENFSIIINGTEFDDLSDYSLGFEDIKNTTQTANGTRVVSHIATKAKITIGWQMLSSERLKEINDALNKTTANRLEYYDYTKKNDTEEVFYVENRSAKIAFFDNENQAVWESYTLTFTQE